MGYKVIVTSWVFILTFMALFCVRGLMQRYMSNHYRNCVMLKIKLLFVTMCLTISLCFIIGAAEKSKPYLLSVVLLGLYTFFKCKWSSDYSRDSFVRGDLFAGEVQGRRPWIRLSSWIRDDPLHLPLVECLGHLPVSLPGLKRYHPDLSVFWKTYSLTLLVQGRISKSEQRVVLVQSLQVIFIYCILPDHLWKPHILGLLQRRDILSRHHLGVQQHFLLEQNLYEKELPSKPATILNWEGNHRDDRN
jgi:hypothetical protein